MNKFEQNLQELLKDKSPQEISADLLVNNMTIKPEQKLVYELIKEFKKLSGIAYAAAYLFADSGPHDFVPEVVDKRCEVLEYLQLVNYGLMEFFCNNNMPEVENNGNQG